MSLQERLRSAWRAFWQPPSQFSDGSNHSQRGPRTKTGRRDYEIGWSDGTTDNDGGDTEGVRI